jgi:hypothetical protein
VFLGIICFPDFIYLVPEIGTSSIDWAKLSKSHLKMEALNKNRRMGTVQKHNICIQFNVFLPSETSQQDSEEITREELSNLYP